jgi:probable HAF family extracellular repeat protein
MRYAISSVIKSVILSLAVVGIVRVDARAATTRYAVTDLGTLGGHAASATAINNRGQVVGSSTTNVTGVGISHAFLYSGGVITDLGTLGGTNSKPFAINDNGDVVGYANTSNGLMHAFLYTSGAMTDLGTLAPGLPNWSINSYAYGINNSGQVVGASYTNYPEPLHAFLYDSSGMTDLGTLGGVISQAFAINQNGQIVGRANTTNAAHAFLCDNGVMSDLGALAPGQNSYAQAVNDSGVVVGYSGASDGQYHAFLYQSGVMSDLGTGSGISSTAGAINNRGQILLGIQYAQSGDSYLYSDGAMEKLSDLTDLPAGWALTGMSGINDNGQIVGEGTNVLGTARAFLLTPRPVLQHLQLVGGQPSFELQGMTGVTYRVDYATSLSPSNWTMLTNVLLSSSPLGITDPATGFSAKRFYRAVQTP